MTEYKNIEKIEEIVDSFDYAMKKGFISGLILLVLEQEPCHGYLIKEKINDLTIGVWNPTVSTLYPLLKALKQKRLIKCVENDESGRHRKVYSITSKGKETLKMLLQKTQVMVDSMKSIALSTIEITDISKDSIINVIEKVITIPELNFLSNNTLNSKIELLKYNRETMKQRIKIMKKNLELIEDMLLKLEANGENNHVEQLLRKIASH